MSDGDNAYEESCSCGASISIPRFESRFAYVRFAVDQMVGAVLSVMMGSWVAVSAWRAEAARLRALANASP